MVESSDMKRAVILKKPSGATAIAGNLDIRERKFYNVFLKVVEEEVKKDIKKFIFEVPLKTLKSALDVKKDDKNNTALKKVIKHMHKIDLEYNVLKKDKSVEGFASLLDNVDFIIAVYGSNTIVKFSIPEIVRQAFIKKDGIYASIDLVVIRGLNSKYAVILYEICKDYEKVQIPKMSIETFRKIFGIENKYPKMPDLRKWVLNFAINELNNNDKIDFLVDYKLIKQGKRYTHIKFTAKPKPAKLRLNQQANKIIESEVKENPDLQELIKLLPNDIKNRVKIINVVLGGIEKKGKEYTQMQIEYVMERFNKGKVKNVEMYLKSAIEKDYASAEKINLDNIIDDWKQKLVDLKKVYVLGGNDYVMKSIQDCDEEDSMCDVQFVSTENSEKIEWARVPEEKLKQIVEKNIDKNK